MADQKVSQTEAVQVKTEEIKQETPAEGEAKVVVKSQPTDASMMNINDKTEQLTSNETESIACRDGDQEFANALASASPMTLLSVQLDASSDPDHNVLAQALNQPQGTQLIVHIQDGSPGEVQVLVDGKLVPVSGVRQVLTTAANAASVPSLTTTNDRSANQPQNMKPHQKGGKKRKHRSVILDEETQLSGASFKSQLLNTSDIIKGLDLAPPTKQVMEYTSTIDSDTLFGFPGRPHSSKQILEAFSRNLTIVKTEDRKRKRSAQKQKLMDTKHELSDDIVSWL